MDEHMSWCTGDHDPEGGCQRVEEILAGVEVALIAAPSGDAVLWLGDVELASVADVDMVVAKLTEYRERLRLSILETLSGD